MNVFLAELWAELLSWPDRAWALLERSGLVWDELDRNEAARLLGGVVSVTRVAETVVITTTTVTVEEKTAVAAGVDWEPATPRG